MKIAAVILWSLALSLRAAEFDVRHFGAVGDGKTFDTAAIQNALDACAGTGGTVTFPPGTYLSQPLTLHTRTTLDLAAGATLVGINNRDLRTFKTDLNHTIRLREQVPAEVVLVAESGIHTRADVERLQAAGVDAILVGESLMRAPDIGHAVDNLLGL